MKFPPASISTDPLSPPALDDRDKDALRKFYTNLRSCFAASGVPQQYQQYVQGMTPAELRSTFFHGLRSDHPDKVLQRFIHHHEFNLDKAFQHFIACLHWRANVKHVDSVIMGEGDVRPAQIAKGAVPASAQEKKNAEDYVKLFEKGEIYVHGTDNHGKPICWIRINKHGSQALEVFERYMLYHIEAPRLLLPSDQWSTLAVFDLTGASLKQMEQGPLKSMLEYFDKYYPWGVANVVIHNAPWVFSGLWKIIRHWIPGKDASDFVSFTKSAKDLEQHMPRSSIPKDMGGDDVWQYKYTPGELTARAAKTADTAGKEAMMQERLELGSKFEELTWKWTESSEKDGPEGLWKEREDAIRNLRVQYWKLDPYVRARSIYDDWGMVQANSKL